MNIGCHSSLMGITPPPHPIISVIRGCVEYEALIASLEPICQTSLPDREICSLDPSGVFTCKTCSQFLTQSLNGDSILLAMPLGTYVQMKVDSFTGTAVHNRNNINDLLQDRKPHKALYLLNFVFHIILTLRQEDHFEGFS